MLHHRFWSGTLTTGNTHDAAGCANFIVKQAAGRYMEHVCKVAALFDDAAALADCGFCTDTTKGLLLLDEPAEVNTEDEFAHL